MTPTHPPALHPRCCSVNRDDMGKFDPATDNVVFVLPLDAPSKPGSPPSETGSWQGTSFFGGPTPLLYQVISNGPGYTLSLNADGSLTVLDSTPIEFGYTTGMPAISSNGASSPLLWSISMPIFDGSTPNALRVYDSTFALLRTLPVADAISKFSLWVPYPTSTLSNSALATISSSQTPHPTSTAATPTSSSSACASNNTSSSASFYCYYDALAFASHISHGYTFCDEYPVF